MDSSSTTTTLLTVAGGLAVFIAWDALRSKTSSVFPLPPGPKRLPVAGNAFQIPNDRTWLYFHQLAEQYGDVVYLEAFGQKILVLDSLDAVNDLMDRRSATYSDRPSTNMIQLMKYEWLVSMMSYGERWRRSRKLMHTHVHSGMIDQYQPGQLRDARIFVRRMMRDPADLPERIRQSFGENIMDLVYGIETSGVKDDKYLTIAEKVLAYFNEAGIPGRYMVDLIPALKWVPSWFPGAGFKKEAKDADVAAVQMRSEPVEIVRKGMASGSAPPSMVRHMLEQEGIDNAEAVQLIKDVAGIVYLGGTDTTVSSVIAFFLALVMRPDVQAKGQAEIDAVIGRDRLPEFDDREHLPYVNAIVSEALRWLPVVPLAVPHTCAQDDMYRGYFIPKGTNVMGNAWAILHDPEAYPDPESFKPERFLKTNDKGELEYNKGVRDPRVACFGFGRRICPGRWLADQALYSMIATTLATLNVSQAKDASGNPIIPKVEVTSGLLSHAKEFPYHIEPRSSKAQVLVEQSLSK